MTAEQSAGLSNAKQTKRRKLNVVHNANRPSQGHPATNADSAATVHSVAIAFVTPKLEELSNTSPAPDSKPQLTVQAEQQFTSTGQQFAAKEESASAGQEVNREPASTAAAQFRGNVKRIKDAEAFQRQKERRQKKAAFLLDGTTTGPVVGVARGGSWGQSAQQHVVRMQGGTVVQLPVRPNRSAALQQRRLPSCCTVL